MILLHSAGDELLRIQQVVERSQLSEPGLTLFAYSLEMVTAAGGVTPVCIRDTHHTALKDDPAVSAARRRMLDGLAERGLSEDTVWRVYHLYFGYQVYDTVCIVGELYSMADDLGLPVGRVPDGWELITDIRTVSPSEAMSMVNHATERLREDRIWRVWWTKPQVGEARVAVQVYRRDDPPAPEGDA